MNHYRPRARGWRGTGAHGRAAREPLEPHGSERAHMASTPTRTRRTSGPRGVPRRDPRGARSVVIHRTRAADSCAVGQLRKRRYSPSDSMPGPCHYRIRLAPRRRPSRTPRNGCLPEGILDRRKARLVAVRRELDARLDAGRHVRHELVGRLFIAEPTSHEAICFASASMAVHVHTEPRAAFFFSSADPCPGRRRSSKSRQTARACTTERS